MAYFAPTQSTVESSDSSIASQVKAMKISEPTFRVEEDPPEIIGSYANLTYTDEVIAGMGSNVRESEFEFSSATTSSVIHCR